MGNNVGLYQLSNSGIERRFQNRGQILQNMRCCNIVEDKVNLLWILLENSVFSAWILLECSLNFMSKNQHGLCKCFSLAALAIYFTVVDLNSSTQQPVRGMRQTWWCINKSTVTWKSAPHDTFLSKLNKYTSWNLRVCPAYEYIPCECHSVMVDNVQLTRIKLSSIRCP